MDLTLAELEQAINYWRALSPSTGEERALSAEVNSLANIYALMIFQQIKSLPSSSLDTGVLTLIDGWRNRPA
jgi:hypothetical protein